MDNVDFVKLLGQGGIAVVALWVLSKMVYKIGERMIAAIDRVGVRIDEHTKADLMAQADVANQVGDLRQDIAVLSTRVDTVLELEWSERTPVRGLPAVKSGAHRAPEAGLAYGSSRPSPTATLPPDDPDPERPDSERRRRGDGEYLISRPGRERGRGDGT